MEHVKQGEKTHSGQLIGLYSIGKIDFSLHICSSSLIVIKLHTII